MCSFHVRLFDIVTPNNLALLTKPNSSLFITIGAKCDSFFACEILRSLHLSLFSLTLLPEEHFATLFAICWALLALPLITTSDTVVSSTYFHIWAIPLSIGQFRIVQEQKNRVEVQGNNQHFVFFKTKENANYFPEPRCCSFVPAQFETSL